MKKKSLSTGPSRPKHQGLARRAFLSFLATAMFIAQIPVQHVLATDLNASGLTAPIEAPHATPEDTRVNLDDLTRLISDEQFEAFQNIVLERENRGLVGFTYQYALPEDNSPVSVIVVFETAPAPVQIFEAFLEGEQLSEAEAEDNVASEHEMFRQELAALFGNQRARNLGYRIQREYRVALNGVSITLPANLVAELAEFESVRAIYPNTQVDLDPVDFVALESAIRNPIGMQPGRATMRADELHELGYFGEGIIVAVLDTGIDYYHPAFEGAFLTIEEAQVLNPELTEADAIRGYFFGRNLVDDLFMLPDLLNPQDVPAANDPMETTRDFWAGSGYPRQLPPPDSRVFYTSHGTHVAGTILGRDTGGDFSILGVAPQARMIAYRVLGAYGSGMMDSIVAGIEYAYLDGADVVNLSLGGSNNTPAEWPTTVAINNIKLASPYVVFVVAAGNSAPGLYTMTAPAAASTAITVANIAEAGYVGVTLSHDGNDYGIAFGSTPASWLAFDADRGISVTTSERLVADEFGAYRIFALPNFNLINLDGVPGYGSAEEFAALAEIHGDDLQGAFVLVRRGAPFADVAQLAYDLGIGGVIAVNHTDDNAVGGIIDLPLPYVFIGFSDGVDLFAAMGEGGSSTITFGELEHSPFRLSVTSSRGPVLQSFEIKPDLGANGSNVWSAVPSWFIDVEDNALAYAYSSGTSMAAPHVAGAVALMFEHSRQRGAQWTAEEVKVRLMNTSIPFESGFYSVFETGTGYVDVYAAIHADVRVTVQYDRVATILGRPFDYQPFQVTGTGSFSFGGQDITNEDADFSRSLTAIISNESNRARTFTITHTYNYGPYETRNPRYIDLSFDQSTITVPAGGVAEFVTTLQVPEGAPTGFFEGHVYVTDADSGEVVARLPFAGVRSYLPPLFDDIFLYRPVITTENVTSVAHNSLGLIVEANVGLAFNAYILRDVAGITEYNWGNDEFEDAWVGFAGQTGLFDVGLLEGVTKRGIVFNGYYIPAGSEEWEVFRGEEGDYLLVLEMFRQVGEEHFDYEKSVILPFAVDNTPPVVTIDDLQPGSNGGYVFEVDSLEPIVVTGNVHDLWMEQAAENGVTFDIWRENPEVGAQFLSVWVQVGNNSPFEVEVDAFGNFEALLGNIHGALPLNVRVFALDSWSVVPEADALMGTGYTIDLYRSAADVFRPYGTGLVFAEPDIHSSLRLATPWGFYPHEIFDHHVWSGLNVAEFAFVVDGDFEAPVLDPNRPSVIFNYDETSPTVFTEMSTVHLGAYHPMESVVVDFGRIAEEMGRVGDDAYVQFLWRHTDFEAIRIGRLGVSWRSLGINPYDSSTHIYVFENPSDYHPLILFGDHQFDGLSHGNAFRWLDGEWELDVEVVWYDREDSANYFGVGNVVRSYLTSSTPVRLDIEELPAEGIRWNEEGFREAIYVGAEPLFIEFNFDPQVDYEDIVFAFHAEQENMMHIQALIQLGFTSLDQLDGYAFPLNIHLPTYHDHAFNNTLFNVPLRIYAWTLYQGVWSFADVSPVIELRSELLGNFPIQRLMQLVGFAEMRQEEFYTRASWAYFMYHLTIAQGLIANYPLIDREDIQAVYENLQQSEWSLESVDVTSDDVRQLMAAIEAEGLIAEDFTSATWTRFQEAWALVEEWLDAVDNITSENPGGPGFPDLPQLPDFPDTDFPDIGFPDIDFPDIGFPVFSLNLESSTFWTLIPENWTLIDVSPQRVYRYLAFHFENLERIEGDEPEYPEEDESEYPEYPGDEDESEYPEYPEEDESEYPEYPRDDESEYPEYPGDDESEYPEYPGDDESEYPEYPGDDESEYPEYPGDDETDYPEYPGDDESDYPEYPGDEEPEYPEYPEQPGDDDPIVEDPKQPAPPTRPTRPGRPNRPQRPSTPERPSTPNRPSTPAQPDRPTADLPATGAGATANLVGLGLGFLAVGAGALAYPKWKNRNKK